jgi:5-methyltetrahydropteroyltriglutamate--homocysteine methyltransferase
MKKSIHRILTTHCGSLPRPKDLLDLMKARAQGEPYDVAAYDSRVCSAVADVVRRQTENGIDIVTDGEQGKTGFFRYIGERLTGFEERPGPLAVMFEAEVADFPEYYQQYFGQAMLGSSAVPIVPLVCTGPIRYSGLGPLKRDLVNLKAALAGIAAEEAFLPAVAPSGVGKNEFYKTQEEYFQALAAAMHEEYQAIVDAGFLVQIDEPFLTELFSYAAMTPGDKRKTAQMYVDAVNHSLRGIPAEQVRLHTCYGINEGPRVHDAPLRQILEFLLQINAGAYSFEAANARHEHEYHVWETINLPESKILIPGVITHASNIVEHPELIAERIVRYARLVGRENVIAGADCGFSSQATYNPEIHPRIVWAKFRALAEGARLATEQLWR